MNKIVHVHIEKTAGTTIKSLYNREYGADNVWGYSASEGRYRSLGKKFFDIDSRRQQEMRARLFRDVPHLARIGQLVLNSLPSHKALQVEEVRDVAKVIIGHFTFDQVSEYLDPAQFSYRTIVRHPLQRMLSHYDFLLRRSVPRSKMRVAALDANALSFEDFSLQSSVQNYQSQAVGMRLDQYGLVGVVDHMDAFLAEAGLLSLGETAPRINKSPVKTPRKLSSSFMNDFETFHTQDYELYHTVLRQWQPRAELQ